MDGETQISLSNLNIPSESDGGGPRAKERMLPFLEQDPVETHFPAR